MLATEQSFNLQKDFHNVIKTQKQFQNVFELKCFCVQYVVNFHSCK